VAYEALTGWAPFGGNTISALTLAVCRETHDRVTAHDPNLPAALDAFFERALAKNPDERFTSAAELSQAFRIAVEQEAGGAGRGPLSARSRWRRRAPILAAVATFATLGGIAWLTLHAPEDPAARSAPAERAAPAGEIEHAGADPRPDDANLGAPTGPPDPQPAYPLATDPPAPEPAANVEPSISAATQAPTPEPAAAQPSPPGSAASTPKLVPASPANSQEPIPAPPSFDESETL
jgi:eukaryotic-like serine/threonine-protein kinase